MSFDSRKPRTKVNHRTPEVADREPECPAGQSLDLSIDPKTGDLQNLDTYKVFMKRNLKWQAPPADLLANIRARIDRIKAAEE